MWEFSLALDSATTQAELDAAPGELTELLSGPMAEGLINLLMLGMAKGIPKLAGKTPGWMIRQTPNGPTPISTQHGPPSHVPGQVTWGPWDTIGNGAGGPSKPPGKGPGGPFTPIPGRTPSDLITVRPSMDWQDAYDYFQLGQPFDGPYTNSLNTPQLSGRLPNAPKRIPGVGIPAVMPPHFGRDKGVAGKHPALMIDGKVFVHHHHLSAQDLAGTRPKPSDLYGWVELDADGNVLWAYWVEIGE
jgi:hypothetical protein